MGQALPNQEIFRRLGGAMGYNPPNGSRTLAGHNRRAGQPYRPGGHGKRWPRRARLICGRSRSCSRRPGGSPRPSGKIEIASGAGAVAHGHRRLPPPIDDPRPRDGLFRLLSPASVWLMNSSYNEDPKVAEKLGAETVTLNPADAARLGLQDGDTRDRRERDRAIGVERLGVADVVPPGVALSHKSRWPKLSKQHANINALNPGRKTDMAESSAIHSVEVALRRKKNSA